MLYCIFQIWHFLFYLSRARVQVKGYIAFRGECWFEIASSCFGEFPGCFEVCTPLSVLTLTQRAMAAAIYTSCGRIGFPHVTDFFSFFSARLSLEFSHATDMGVGVGEIIERRIKRSAFSSSYALLFYVVIFCRCWVLCVQPRRLSYSKEPGSQSESPNQCISYNSHSLLILPLKFMLLFSGTPCCGPRCLPHRRVTVTQECWARCRVIPSDAPQLPKNHIHRHYRTISHRPHWNTTHTKSESPALPALLLAFFFFFNSINNGKCKSPEQMLREKRLKKNWGRWRVGRTERKKKKNTSGEQNNPAGPPLPLEASEVTLCFCEGACEQNGLWSWVTALYCGITTATTKPLQKCAGWL